MDEIYESAPMGQQHTLLPMTPARLGEAVPASKVGDPGATRKFLIYANNYAFETILNFSLLKIFIGTLWSKAVVAFRVLIFVFFDVTNLDARRLV